MRLPSTKRGEMKFLASAIAIASMCSAASADVLTFDCRFSMFASPDGVEKLSEDFRMVFRFDDFSGDAFMEGNLGLPSVRSVVGSMGITFLEVLSTGAVQSTTITNSGGAVHSRSTMISGELAPSQYYGTCR